MPDVTKLLDQLRASDLSVLHASALVFVTKNPGCRETDVMVKLERARTQTHQLLTSLVARGLLFKRDMFNPQARRKTPVYYANNAGSDVVASWHKAISKDEET